MFKWFWTIFSLGAPDVVEIVILPLLQTWKGAQMKISESKNRKLALIYVSASVTSFEGIVNAFTFFKWNKRQHVANPFFSYKIGSRRCGFVRGTFK